MELILVRQAPIGVALPGRMTLDGRLAAYTLERLPVSIPASRYQITLYRSPHFGRLMPMLLNVPSRSDILIHWGNYPQNSEGCILVGEEQDPSTGDIFNTQKKFNELFPAIEAAVESEGCWITISDSSQPDDWHISSGE